MHIVTTSENKVDRDGRTLQLIGASADINLSVILLGHSSVIHMYTRVFERTPTEMMSRGLEGDLSYQIAVTHLYILYLVEKPCRFFSTKSMYSEEW